MDGDRTFPDNLVQLEVEDSRVEEIVKEFLRSEAGDLPVCEDCETEFQFQFSYSESPRIEIFCQICGIQLVWQQNRSVGVWAGLHLDYFMERYLNDDTIRCPFDDCRVNIVEHSDGLLEFRCLFCNRTGSRSAVNPEQRIKDR